MGTIASGQWKQMKGKVRQQWGKLTDDDVAKIGGDRERLVGRLQEAYGKARNEIEAEVDKFFSKMS